jgi:hypothetical protein
MIIKLSSSGKQLQVVDDDGCVFGTSVEWVKGLLEGRSPSGFLLLTRLPLKVAKGRYKPSPVWNPVSGEREVPDELLSTANDAVSAAVLRVKREGQGLIDKVVF